MTSSHEPFDETAKAFYYRLFKNWGLSVETEREVFSHSRTIDLVVRCTNADRSRLQNTVFAHLRQLNAIELKGFHDPLTVDNYNRIMMRTWGLGVQKLKSKSGCHAKSEHPQLANEITVTIVCITRPNKILNQLEKEYRFVSTEDSGIYYCNEVLGKWIIHPSELELVEKNYPLLPLARGNKLEEFISLCVRKGLNDYLQLIMDIGLATDPDMIWHKILEVSKMKHLIREETWPIIDQFFQEMPEAMGKLPTFQEVLVESQRQFLQQGLQQGIQQGEQIGEKSALIRQLRRKFTGVPEGLIQQIEATTDIAQLDHWLDQIIFADNLADMDFN